MSGRNGTLLLLGFALSSAGCWVGTEPPHVEHHEHAHRAPPEDGDDHHDEHHDDKHHHDEHREYEHHD